MTDPDLHTTTLTTPTDREIVITRSFNAPRPLVFKAWTRPEHVRHWYGPAGTTLAVCEIDLRPGGRYRFVVRAPDGQEYGFTGVYREVVPPERLVYTDSFEGAPGHEALVTALFEEMDGKTRLTSTSLYASLEERDAHIRSGMEGGMKQTLDRLTEHLLTMR